MASKEEGNNTEINFHLLRVEVAVIQHYPGCEK